MSARKRPNVAAAVTAILGTVPGVGDRQVLDLPVEQLRPSSFQPRRTFDEAKHRSLTASVREQGVLSPLLVRRAPGGYEVIAGERRLRAARAAGLATVPCDLRDLTDDQARLIAVAENLQRDDLSTIDEVDATLTLVALRLNLTPDEARRQLTHLSNYPDADPDTVETLDGLFAQLGRGTWQSFARNKVRVLNWPPLVLNAMREEALKFSLAGVVAAAPAEHQGALLDLARTGASRESLRAELERLTRSEDARQNAQIARDVTRALNSKRRMDALPNDKRKKVDRLLSELHGLLQDTRMKE